MKRLFDFLISLVSLILLLPFLTVIAFIAYFRIGSPIFFSQNRPGLNGTVFEIIKFRTMLNKKDIHGNLLPDNERMTKFGSFLRSTSLDELPALYNVIRGDMSLVGPRPLLVRYLSRYNTEQARRHDVRPGLTGWAQVNGRNAISWEKKFEFDVWYVDNQSFWLDIKILLLTVKKVFVKEGISSENHVTMEEFKGDKNDG